MSNVIAASPGRAPAETVAHGTHEQDLVQIARAALADRIGRCRKATGAVAALIERTGTHIVCEGETGCADGRALDEHTVFEAGCVLHTFDALLLAVMSTSGEIDLAEPIERYLPGGVAVPRLGRPITCEHLATHTSGLPGRPTHVADGSLAAARNAAEDVYEFLAMHRPVREAGTQWEYSHIGIRLLRQVLSLRGGADYETLLRRRVFEPLQMTSTGLAHTAGTLRRMAAGHNDRLEPVSRDTSELHSTAHDLALFLRACLGFDTTPLDAAVARMLSVRYPSGPHLAAALGWEVDTQQGDDLVCQNGVSPGFRAWLGYRPCTSRGVVILSNAATVAGMLDIGYHLLDARYELLTADVPLLRASVVPQAVVLPEHVLDAHVGLYQLTPGVMIIVTREGQQLFADRFGKGRVAIVPHSPVEFFCREVDFYELPADTRVTFDRGDDGATVGMKLHQRGQVTWLPRVGYHASPVWFGNTAVTLDPERLARYTGSYRMFPTMAGYHLGTTAIAVAPAEGSSRLVAEFDTGMTVLLTPRSDMEFFVENDVSNIEFRFEFDVAGRAAGLVGTFDGVPWRGVRVEASS